MGRPTNAVRNARLAEEQRIRVATEWTRLREMSNEDLLREVVQAALDVGSCHWDSYGAPARWPEMEDCLAYQELRRRLSE